LAPKRIYIDVLRGAGTYSESGQRAKYRANGGLAARHSLEDFTKRRVIWWGIPHISFGDRRGIRCASVAYCLPLSEIFSPSPGETYLPARTG
jgi:hypothetical protein